MFIHCNSLMQDYTQLSFNFSSQFQNSLQQNLKCKKYNGYFLIFTPRLSEQRYTAICSPFGLERSGVK